jgi:hypothetical protein
MPSARKENVSEPSCCRSGCRRQFTFPARVAYLGQFAAARQRATNSLPGNKTAVSLRGTRPPFHRAKRSKLGKLPRLRKRGPSVRQALPARSLSHFPMRHCGRSAIIVIAFGLRALSVTTMRKAASTARIARNDFDRSIVRLAVDQSLAMAFFANHFCFCTLAQNGCFTYFHFPLASRACSSKIVAALFIECRAALASNTIAS